MTSEIFTVILFFAAYLGSVYIFLSAVSICVLSERLHDKFPSLISKNKRIWIVRIIVGVMGLLWPLVLLGCLAYCVVVRCVQSWKVVPNRGIRSDEETLTDIELGIWRPAAARDNLSAAELREPPPAYQRPPPYIP